MDREIEPPKLPRDLRGAAEKKATRKTLQTRARTSGKHRVYMLHLGRAVLPRRRRKPPDEVFEVGKRFFVLELGCLSGPFFSIQTCGGAIAWRDESGVFITIYF